MRPVFVGIPVESLRCSLSREPVRRRSAAILSAVRVLLVEDEERMVAALRRGLTAEGFVVESARTG